MSIREARDFSALPLKDVQTSNFTKLISPEGRDIISSDVPEKGSQAAISNGLEEGQPATEEELRDLLHVVDDIPFSVWLVQIVGAAERSTWYGNTGPLPTPGVYTAMILISLGSGGVKTSIALFMGECGDAVDYKS
ncbi:MAG: hypothetical protein Q9160_006144 [Pyrenula sp. 1 TL-2023]